MSTPRRTRLAAVVALACASILVAACGTPSPQPSETSSDSSQFRKVNPLPPVGTPTVMAEPTIVWADGIEPTSPLEDNNLVKIMREVALGHAMAWNSGDFTIEQYTRHYDERGISRRAGRYSRQGDNPYVYPALTSWQPLGIVSESSLGGEVIVCTLNTYRETWERTKDHPGGVYDRSNVSVYRAEIEIRGAKSIMTVFQPYGGYDGEFGSCDGSVIPVGFIDPPPELPATPVTQPVREPLIPNWREVCDPLGTGLASPSASPTDG